MFQLVPINVTEMRTINNVWPMSFPVIYLHWSPLSVETVRIKTKKKCNHKRNKQNYYKKNWNAMEKSLIHPQTVDSGYLCRCSRTIGEDCSNIVTTMYSKRLFLIYAPWIKFHLQVMSGARWSGPVQKQANKQVRI